MTTVATSSVFSVEGNTQRLDGGAMFGNCPRPVWARWSPPDEQHRIRLACRSLLVREASGRHVLVEAGIGAFFEPKMRERFGVIEAEHVLLKSLAELSVRPEEIDVIVLSHLHFDHAGGLLMPWREGGAAELAFPRAKYVVSEHAWRRALDPHPRDRASFIPALQPLLEATGRLEILEAPGSEGETQRGSVTLGDGYSFTLSDGHTPGLLLTTVEQTPRGPITFLGDLVPGVPWVHLPITMGYDRFPELLIDEKRKLLERAAGGGAWLFFTHDPDVAASRIGRDAAGKFSAIEPLEQVRWAAS
jgi:glyoxylase-like metal-dependent hydrolase (beta-lactamase superfamily II)